LLLAGCISNHIGVGAIQPMTQQERNDPDPRAPIYVPPGTPNPWATTEQAAPPPPGSRAEIIQRTAATIAAFAAGAIPAIVWYGTFDENRLIEKPQAKPADPAPQQ
jgi:hypothetical protein